MEGCRRQWREGFSGRVTAEHELRVRCAQAASTAPWRLPPDDFQLAEVARRHDLPRSTMQRALQVLEGQHFLRQDFSRTGVRWRLEDPFMRPWLMELQAQ